MFKKSLLCDALRVESLKIVGYSEKMRSRVVGLLGLVLLLALTIAAADSLADAKQLFAQGKKAYADGDFTTALERFLRADELAPAPNLTYNIGRTYENLNRPSDAIGAFEKFLRQAPLPKNAADRRVKAEVKERIEHNRGLLAQSPRSEPEVQPPSKPVSTTPPEPPVTTQKSAPSATPAPQPRVPPTPPRENRDLYGYNPQYNRQAQLNLAYIKKTRGIQMLVIGGILTVVGVVLIVDGVINPHGGSCIGQGDAFSCPTYAQAVNVLEIFLGSAASLAGLVLTPVGAVSLVQGQRTIDVLTASGTPQASSGDPGARPGSLLHSANTGLALKWDW